MTALVFTGCVRVRQDLMLNPDGSGSLYIVYGVKEQDIKRMGEVSRQMAAIDPSLTAQDVDWLVAFDEEAIRREWNRTEHDGVRLLGVSTEDRDGWKYMRADIRFDSLQKLIDTGMLSECQISLTRGPNGQYGFIQSFNLEKVAKSLPPGMDISSLRPMMGIMMADFRGEFTVQMPGRIIRSNADKLERENRAVWAMSGAEPGLMERLENFDIRLMFDGKNTRIADAHVGN